MAESSTHTSENPALKITNEPLNEVNYSHGLMLCKCFFGEIKEGEHGLNMVIRLNNVLLRKQIMFLDDKKGGTGEK